MKKISMLFSIIMLVFFVNTTFAKTKAEIGSEAPNFTLTSAVGKSHSLADFKGKYVVLEWVNFDCPFVKKHYSSNNMQNLQKEMTSKEVVWLSICSSAEGKQGHFAGQELLDRIKKEGSKATAYLIDEDGSVGKMYGAKTTPHCYVISPEGNLIYAGAIDDKPSADAEDIKTSKNLVKSCIDEAISGSAVSTATSKPYGCGVKYK
jgi:peroxiredoxin